VINKINLGTATVENGNKIILTARVFSYSALEKE
jgi:hypothetical protein